MNTKGAKTKHENRKKYVLVGVLSFLAGIAAVFLCVLLILGIGGGNAVEEELPFDSETYLSHDTEFCRNASQVMPSLEELSDSDVVYYFYRGIANDARPLAMTRGYVRLTAAYSDEKFINESQRLKELYEKPFDGNCSAFYLNGDLFHGVQYEYEQALAYHICSDSKTITYIAFHSEELQYMSIGDALKDCLPSDREDQIVSYKGT